MVEIHKIYDTKLQKSICEGLQINYDKNLIFTGYFRNAILTCVFVYHLEEKLAFIDGITNCSDLVVLSEIGKTVLFFLEGAGFMTVCLSPKYPKAAKILGFQKEASGFILNLSGYKFCDCGKGENHNVK